MKRFFTAAFAVLMLVLFTACGGTPDETIDTSGDAKFDLDIIGGNYKIIYDITDSNAMGIMTDMVAKIETASGVKLPSSNSSNPESEYEIQFGLKSGRADGEAVYNEIKDYADEVYGAYAIRAVGNKVIISASDRDALKVAADRFASMASSVFVVRADFDETAIFDVGKAKYGKVEPILDFRSSTLLSSILCDGKTVGVVEGKNNYYRGLEGKTDLPEISVKSKYPGAKIEITKLTYDYEIKVKSADGTKEEIYGMSFIETAPLDSYNLDTWITPYWDGYITYHESVMFIGDEGAPLLYKPEDIFSVRSWDLKTEYVEGVD